ncbi:MAG: hypothetical protein JEY99_19415 [Spirochaetales bacterium]|nr:hypothetical protein [Spirochaetales bacterium]
MLLQSFRDELLDSLLQFLWRQWSLLGLAGYGDSEDDWVIDPEALLLFSASIARYDQRLFDEMLDWLVLNERFINVQRLNVIMKKEGFESSRIINAAAGEIHRRKSGLKWKKLAEHKDFDGELTNLFYLKSGSPMPVTGEKDSGFLEYGLVRNPVKHRGLSKTFPERKPQSLLLQLRGLMGVNSRSEILLYLLLNKKGTIQEIADQNYYAWRTVQDVLFEIGHSSVIHFPEAKRGRFYYLDPEPWMNILLGSNRQNIRWICWPAFFRSLEIIWLKLNEPDFIESHTLEQAAEFKQLIDIELGARIVKSGFGQNLGPLSGVWGEEYLITWIETIKGLLSQL